MKAVQMDNLRGFLGIRRMDRIPNAQIRELCGVRKGLAERIAEGVLRWFGHVERDRIARRVCRSVQVVVQWVALGRDGLIRFKEKRFGCQASMENGSG